MSLLRVGFFAAMLVAVGCNNSGQTAASSSGGAGGRGGTTGSGGATGSGGTSTASSAPVTGGTVGTGGSTDTGGSTGTGGSGGSKATGGATGSGGTTSTATVPGSGGISSDGGSRASGGSTSTGGVSGSGGSKATGGATASGGTSAGSGGATASGGTGTGAMATGGGGGTGTGGGAGGGTTSPVTPTQGSGGSKYQLAFGDVIFEVDSQAGARVSKLSLGGTDMIVSSGTAADKTDWGSVFWASPRSSWSTPQQWPPPTAFDNAAYPGGISGNDLLFNGPTDSTMGLSFTKDYSADAASGWITIVYTINATKALKAGPWEDTRVPRGGIVFYPAGTALTKGPLTMTTTAGINWFDDASKSATSPDGSKAYGDGASGWAAYALNGILFLKKYTDQPASALAPSEGEVDIYPGTGFLEFEVLGPYTSIAAGANLPWTIKWRIVKIPSSVTVSVGSTTLVDFAKQQAAL